MPAETRDIRTLSVTDEASGRPITRLQYRGWFVDVDAHVVSVPRQIVTTQHLADLHVCLVAAHTMARTNARPAVTSAAPSAPRPTPTDILVTLLEDARSIAENQWHPNNFDIYACTRTAWAEAESAWDVPFTDVLNALRRGLAPDTNLTEFSDKRPRTRRGRRPLQHRDRRTDLTRGRPGRSMTTPPTCPLPGCTNPTTQPGTPCQECLDAFGSYLAPAPPRAIPATAEQITADLAARDRGIAAAYTMQAATEVAATTTDRPAYEAAVLLLAERGVNAASPVSKVIAAAEVTERKANQRCWVCEERRTCTREAIGWACDSCRAIDSAPITEGERP